MVADRSENEGSLQNECLTGAGGVITDDLRDALQPVPHGVGVHEEFPGGGLEGPSIVEIAPQGREKFS
jgi:hypothetical protein